MVDGSVSRSPQINASSIGEPFPLKRRYFVRVVPGMVLFMGVLSGVLWFAFDRVTQHIYLEQAQNRTNVIVDGLKDSSHEVWDAFLAGRATPQDLETLGVIFKESVEQQKLISLKVYDLKGVVIYDVFPDKIGMIETAPSLRYVILNNQATLLRKNAADGSIAYEIYIPHTDRDGNLRAIFELYEEVSYLDTLLLETAIPAIAVPVVLLMVLMFVLGVLVLRAQTDIDQRTEAIGELSRRLESFVSASALEAAKNAGNASVIPSRKIVCTLFHSDVRDFTSFAENNQPERVVYFLNDLMSIQVRVVTHFGGDVDKMIGDALLVRFEGEEAEQRAINAAKSILDIVQRASLARGVGIGIFTGQVISGAIGPESRRDFTVIGDSVNMSARLCSHANSGEIIADAATVRAAEAKGFGPTENLQVKGHAEPVAVQRWNIEQMAKKG